MAKKVTEIESRHIQGLPGFMQGKECKLYIEDFGKRKLQGLRNSSKQPTK